MMKKLFTLALLSAVISIAQAQDYVDVVKFSSTNATLEDETGNHETDMNNLFFDVNVPIEKSDELVLLTGITTDYTNLSFTPGLDDRGITMVRAKVGVKINHSETFSGTYMLLPKMASDFGSFTGDDFQFGGLALFTKQKSDQLVIKYGGYMSTEEFGSVFTPLVGLFYRSQDEKLYVNGTFPIRGDINYQTSESFSFGADLRTSIKGYGLNDHILFDDRYVQEESIRAGLYGAVHFLDNKLMLKGRIGLESTDYALYNDGDQLGLQILTFSVSDDNRNRLNQEFDSALNFGGEIIYRFDLRDRD